MNLRIVAGVMDTLLVHFILSSLSKFHCYLDDFNFECHVRAFIFKSPDLCTGPSGHSFENYEVISTVINSLRILLTALSARRFWQNILQSDFYDIRPSLLTTKTCVNSRVLNLSQITMT